MIRTVARISLWLFVCLCLVGFGSSVVLASSSGRAPALSGTSAPDAVVYFDGFGTAMKTGWSWVREDAAQWSLTQRSGYLRIRTQEGTLDNNSLANNILRRAAPVVDYEVSTRVELNLSQNFHEAALMLYTGDSNFVKVSRIYDSAEGGSIFLLRREVAGVGVGAFFSPVITGTVADMRIRFSAPNVSAAYKDGSGNWVDLGQYSVGPINTYTYVALAAHHGFPTVAANSINADFDFLQIVEVFGLHLPFLSR